MTDSKANGAGTTETRNPRFHLIPFEELKPGTDLDYLIKGLFPRVGLIIVYGEKGCGKSFWTTDAVLHLALGWEYRGRRVLSGPVVYCAFEGADGYNKRAEAFRLRFLAEQAEPVPFYLVAAKMVFLADHSTLIACIEAQLGGKNPVAVVLDTLNRSIGGKEDDENMAGYVRAADGVREKFNCAVLVIHHCGKNNNGPRGHSSLAGAADAVLLVKRDANQNIVVTIEHMKDGPEDIAIVSRLERVEIGTDADGDPVTSCVIVPVEIDASTHAQKTRKLSDRQRLALEALSNCAADRGAPPPDLFGLPSGILCITVDEWRTELHSRGVIEPTSKNPRADFKRLKESLQARHLMAERDGHVWSVTP